MARLHAVEGGGCDKFNEVLTMFEKREVKYLSDIFSIKYAENLYKACLYLDDTIYYL